jgi:galactose oxidase
MRTACWSGCCRLLVLYGVAALLLLWTPQAAQAADPAVEGQYAATKPAPFRAMHAHMLPTGKVMFWDAYDQADHAQLWDPSSESFTPAAQAGYNIFCSGFSFLPNGHLLVTGGHIADFVGLANAATYNPFTNTWTPLPDMRDGRWYPTNTPLPNGDALVVSGQIDNTQGMNPWPQVWQPQTGTWRDLTSAPLGLPFYPYMYVAPNGKVFLAGPGQTTRYLDTASTGAWSVVANNTFGDRTWGSSAMYGPGQVMIAGGTKCAAYDSGCDSTPTNTVELIDLNSGAPAWRPAASMTYPRKQHNMTLLPDGQVLVTGGSNGAEPPPEVPSPVLAAEMWDPATGTWTPLARLSVARAYHAVALLLPDGRVFSAGGNFDGSYEVFSPPYLFKGTRPTITSAPTAVGYGQTFVVATPEAASITKVTLLALGTVTHAFNQGQRLTFLTFTPGSGGLNVTMPASAALAPPGYYMLFIVNGNGVPSVATFVQVQAAVEPPPAAPSGLTATRASNKSIDLRWQDNATNESGFQIEQSTDGVNFSRIRTVGANVTTFTNTGLRRGVRYFYRVRAYNSSGNSPYSDVASATP